MRLPRLVQQALPALVLAPWWLLSNAQTALTTPDAAARPLLDAINAYRAAGAQCGERGSFAPAPPLAWNAALERAAAVQVRDMAQRQDATHGGSDGSSVSQRVEHQGYAWRSVGENVAAGRATAGATLAQWMASPGHCANLMGAGFKDVAVASQQLPGTRYGWYWVMVLAAPE